MKDYDIPKFPADLYNNIYGQIQYEIIESVKEAILNFSQIDSEIKDDLIKDIEKQIKQEQIEIRKMIELSNFQYTKKEERRRKEKEYRHIKSYKLDCDYGFKPEFKDRLY